MLSVHAQSLDNVAEAILGVAGSADRPLDEAIKMIPSRELQPRTQFLRTLAQQGAELRLAFHDSTSASLTAEQIGNAVARSETFHYAAHRRTT